MNTKNCFSFGAAAACKTYPLAVAVVNAAGEPIGLNKIKDRLQ